MTLDEIKELISLVLETGVAELEVRRGDNSVRIRRSANASEVMVSTSGAIMAAETGSPAGSGSAVQPLQNNTPVPPPVPDANLTTVKSPIVGTYYDAPSPGAPPFVKVGDTIQPGQILCIIESMKLMNEIEAEVAGIVAGKLVENGRAVEYGETLFTVRPR